MKTEHDNKLARCPKLGDEMTFAYCLRESGDIPCSRIVNCWSSSFDVAAFLKDFLTPEQFDKFSNSRPNDKVTSLIELIEAAKAKK
jgi:hypothetical protein